jgi:hypothetical protein
MAARYPLVLNGTSIEELQAADTLAGVDAFASGTAMLFIQTAAPTGWTKSTTHNDKALRIVNGAAGSGGSTAFSSIFGSRTPAGSINTSGLSAGATTLSTSQMPAHAHALWGSVTNSSGAGTGLASGGCRTVFGSGNGDSLQYIANGPTGGAQYVQNTGGGGSHSHSMSGSATFTGTAMDFAVQYVDAIIATKN